jgi:hypothetical protein
MDFPLNFIKRGVIFKKILSFKKDRSHWCVPFKTWDKHGLILEVGLNRDYRAKLKNLLEERGLCRKIVQFSTVHPVLPTTTRFRGTVCSAQHDFGIKLSQHFVRVKKTRRTDKSPERA